MSSPFHFRIAAVVSIAITALRRPNGIGRGAAPQRDIGALVLGVSLARSENLTLTAHYTLEAAGGYTAQTADIRLRYQF